MRSSVDATGDRWKFRGCDSGSGISSRAGHGGSTAPWELSPGESGEFMHYRTIKKDYYKKDPTHPGLTRKSDGFFAQGILRMIFAYEVHKKNVATKQVRKMGRCCNFDEIITAEAPVRSFRRSKTCSKADDQQKCSAAWEGNKRLLRDYSIAS